MDGCEGFLFSIMKDLSPEENEARFVRQLAIDFMDYPEGERKYAADMIAYRDFANLIEIGRKMEERHAKAMEIIRKING